MADEGDIEKISSAAVLATAKKPKAKRACVEDVDEGELSTAQIEELQNEISEQQRTLSAATRTDSTNQETARGSGGQGEFGRGRGSARGGARGEPTSTGRGQAFSWNRQQCKICCKGHG
eukprot:38781-Rhodomonas_salina.1